MRLFVYWQFPPISAHPDSLSEKPSLPLPLPLPLPLLSKVDAFVFITFPWWKGLKILYPSQGVKCNLGLGPLPRQVSSVPFFPAKTARPKRKWYKLQKNHEINTEKGKS